MNQQLATLQKQLEIFLSAETNCTARVEKAWPLAGGASRETWAIDLLIEGGSAAGRYPLVLRLDTASTMHADALSRAHEFRLLQVAYEGGVWCPRPRWLCTDTFVLGAPFFLMDRVEGEAIGTKVVRRPELAAARALLPAQMAQQLALIHTLPWQDLNFLPRPAPGVTPAQHIINGLRRVLHQLQANSPGLTAALRWLERNQPPAAPHTLLHSDFRLGNLIVNQHGLAAVIDWEFAHLGDPLEDLAWPLVRDWRFGNDTLRLGGIAEAEPYLVAYEAATGRPLDRHAVTYWEIMGNVKWAVTCLAQAERHLSGRDLSVELASLGRRSAEMELEALRLISQLQKMV
jgi:aminoglycoside phosphotransferase (APT) family kinase protein